MAHLKQTTAKTILFIEDQEGHYEQVAAYLRLHGHHCRRVTWAEASQIRDLAEKLRPVAAVVDFVLLSISQPELDRMVRDYLAHPAAPPADDAPAFEEHYGVASIPGLRQACPGIKILVYSQYAKPGEMYPQTKLYGADAGVPKERDSDGNLTDRNAQEIAAEVRKLIE